MKEAESKGTQYREGSQIALYSFILYYHRSRAFLKIAIKVLTNQLSNVS